MEGFRVQLREIFEHLPEKRQNLMFSATMIEEVEDVIEGITGYYDKIEAAPSGAPLENIDQSYYEAINFNTKANLLELLFNENPDMSRVLVFVGTKKMSQALYERMEPIFGEAAGLIHSSKSQNNRFESVRQLQEGEIRFLICTDIIARGIDVSMVTHVINFDLPSHSEKYIHRIGRTGRAKEKGKAISFIIPEEESYRLGIEGLMKKSLTKMPIPENLEINEDLIDLEKTVEFVPFNSHKMRTKKATGGTFHEKSKKNKKTVLKKSDIREKRNLKLKKKKNKQKKKRKK